MIRWFGSAFMKVIMSWDTLVKFAKAPLQIWVDGWSKVSSTGSNVTCRLRSFVTSAKTFHQGGCFFLWWFHPRKTQGKRVMQPTSFYLIRSQISSNSDFGLVRQFLQSFTYSFTALGFDLSPFKAREQLHLERKSGENVVTHDQFE